MEIINPINFMPSMLSCPSKAIPNFSNIVGGARILIDQMLYLFVQIFVAP